MSETWLLGIQAVRARLKRERPGVRELLIQAGSRNRRLEELRAEAARHGVPVREVPAATLERIAEGLRHQGVAARAAAEPEQDEHALPGLLARAGEQALLLVLDGVQDPHNLGACLRSAEAAGCLAAILPRDGSAPLSPVARRAAAGAAEHLPILRVTNLARALRALREGGFFLVGLDDEAPAVLHGLDLRGRIALVLGGEAEGLRRLTREHCDFLARLPMLGRVESLNVSVAAGVALYEALRQQGRLAGS
ncbi:MAG: 23S rRNA (guanosine(2251)-2'-O)-methyltransferase RlmB [Xanthomonadales bacterium]|nr:23S rRNA (guanosine(2251)-2'-O)-methyltransferase RlmB [Xanthomonadales bacterium]